MSASHSSKIWPLFCKIVIDLLSVSIIAITLMLVVRVVIYCLLAPANLLSDWPTLLVYSLRWDAKLLATWGLLVLLPSVFAMLSVRAFSMWRSFAKYLNAAFLVIIAVLTLLNIFYWQSVGNSYDAFLFSVADDETAAVLRIFWNEYHPLRNGILLVIAVAVIIWWANKLTSALRLPLEKIQSVWTMLSVSLLLMVTFVIAARGSVSLFPLSQKTTHFSSSMFMNELSINAPVHFYYAWLEASHDVLRGDPKKQLQARGFQNIQQANTQLMFQGAPTEFGVPLIAKSHARVDGKLPNVVFVMMESWSTQLLLADSPTNDTLGSFRDAQKKGALFTQFLSTRLGTGRFIESTLLNTSLLGLTTSSAKKMKFQYSNIAPFIQAKYHAAFVSGGARTWLNHGNFWRAQGVENYWDMTDIMNAYGIEKHSDWGVHDEYMYKFALEKMQGLAQAENPFFMFLITTSNHPPHRIPTGYSVGAQRIDDFSGHLTNPENATKQMATFKYSSDQLGIFLRELEKSGLAENTIVVATGDHTMRMFYQYAEIQDKLLAGSVPFYIQVPEKYLQGKHFNTRMPGSQRDIFPTIFELALPNVDYLKTGFNLLDDTEPKAGWYDRDIWLTDHQVSFEDEKSAYKFNDKLKVGEAVPVSSQMIQYRNHIKAIEALLEWQVRQEYLAGKK